MIRQQLHQDEEEEVLRQLWRVVEWGMRLSFAMIVLAVKEVARRSSSCTAPLSHESLACAATLTTTRKVGEGEGCTELMVVLMGVLMVVHRLSSWWQRSTESPLMG
jgi:hypothetical protein